MLRKLFYPIIFCITLASCYSPRYVYSPATQNIPELYKKNDLIITPSYAVGISGNEAFSNGYNHGVDLNSAYALTNHFALMLNLYNRWEKNGGDNSFSGIDSSTIRYKRSLTELAIGYYKNMKPDSSVYFQFFLGGSFGKSSIKDEVMFNGNISSKFHKADVTKIFIQPSFTFGQTRNFSAALSSRFTAVMFNKINSNYTPTELDNYFLDSLATSSVFFWEPAFSFSYGYKKVPGLKLQLQLSNTVLLNRRFIDYRSFNLSFGLAAEIRKLFARKPSAAKG